MTAGGPVFLPRFVENFRVEMCCGIDPPHPHPLQTTVLGVMYGWDIECLSPSLLTFID